MAADLKSMYNRQLIESLAADLHAAWSPFPVNSFVAACLDGLEAHELLGRANHIAEAMHRHLPAHFPETADILLRSLANGDRKGGFRYMPYGTLVSRHGLGHFEESMRLQYELTKLFTSEFSIRAFFETHPEATHARFVEWSKDENVHVRRLVSEGSRPRLPWGTRLRAFQQDPSPVIALLDLLKDDPELYVRRSVANSLNDITKDHPDIAVEVCRRWSKDATPERRWIIRQALRSLVKQGHPGALEILGFAGKPKVRVAATTFSVPSLQLGETLRFSFDLESTAARAQTLLVDYAVHYVKASGKTSRKVFKLTSVKLSARGKATVRGSLAFRQLTTRQHYPGTHAFDLLLNGISFPVGSVELQPFRVS